MNFLDKLKDLNDKRAPGPWNPWFVATGSQENAKGEHFPLAHGAGPPHEIRDDNDALNKAGADAEFIAFMANHADKLIAVVEAAKRVRDFEYLSAVEEDRSEPRDLIDLGSALAALEEEIR